VSLSVATGLLLVLNIIQQRQDELAHRSDSLGLWFTVLVALVRTISEVFLYALVAFGIHVLVSWIARRRAAAPAQGDS